MCFSELSSAIQTPKYLCEMCFSEILSCFPQNERNFVSVVVVVGEPGSGSSSVFLCMTTVLSVLISISFLVKKLSALLRIHSIPSLVLLIQTVSSTKARWLTEGESLSRTLCML